MEVFDRSKLPAEAVAGAAADGRPTVLIVDDKEANLSVMTAVLRPHFTLIEAHSGEEALGILEALARDGGPACIVSDQRMPGLSGVEVLARAARLAPCAPRIIVSGYIDAEDMAESINKAQIFRFIAKPFDAADLLDAVREAVAAGSRQRDAGAAQQKLATSEARVAALESQLASALARVGQLEGR